MQAQLFGGVGNWLMTRRSQVQNMVKLTFMVYEKHFNIISQNAYFTKFQRLLNGQNLEGLLESSLAA